MANEINIAEILANKPKGTKLYSPACGKCNLVSVENDTIKVSFYNARNGFMIDGGGRFDNYGRMYDEAECCLFPSKEMQDWSKFAWKKGNVLVSKSCKENVIFSHFADDNYKTFIGKYMTRTFDTGVTEYVGEEFTLQTLDFMLDRKMYADNYINAIEKKLGGKLNFDTLKIEKAESNPKYRPFYTAEECWKEIEKHSYPGWIKEKGRGFRHQITSVVNTGCYLPYCNPSNEEDSNISYEQLLDLYTFIDGAPFGKLAE